MSFLLLNTYGMIIQSVTKKLSSIQNVRMSLFSQVKIIKVGKGRNI